MTFTLRERGIDAVLLDIEGTTTPIAFVHEVLFPFARRALAGYVRDRVDAPELQEAFASLRAEWERDVASGQAPPPWRERTRDERVASIVAYATWLMDRDRKASGLKTLQGHIWALGYESGELRGEAFADVPPALSRWKDAGITIAIFSSGSVFAQRLLFGNSRYGDLTPWLAAYFDTSVGPKVDPESYRRIAASLGRPAERILFISDDPQELDAARAAGCSTLFSDRPGNPERPPADTPTVSTFDAIAV